ncbi:MAG: lysine 5,6-aminomutase subunit alpha [Bacillota bacterium]
MKIDRFELDAGMIERARAAAKAITGRMQQHIDAHTTTAVERTVCRLLGINGVDEAGVPLPNVVVDAVADRSKLGRGVAYWLGSACLEYGITPDEAAKDLALGKLDITACPRAREEVEETLAPIAASAVERILENKKKREELIDRLGLGQTPWLYVIVATGNIYEDMVQAKAAARQGADIIAVIRSTGQSLLDYVPYGATTEGFGGTYATQENFRLMRAALDEVGEEIGKYVRLVNYSSGLCMPEIAALGAMERLDVMLSDSMYGILFRDINMERTFVDQFFSRRILALGGLIINTGEDNYLTTDDAYESAHTVIASQFINEQFALASGLAPWQIGLGHAFQMNPHMEDGLLNEIAQAQLIRQLFPEYPIKFMPPTKYMTGNIFFGHLLNAMFNFVSVLTGQSIHLLGMLTEAIHTPYLQDRHLSIENAKYIMNNARHLADEVVYAKDGRIEKRARYVLEKAVELLDHIERRGLMEALEEGTFAAVRRPRKGGKGYDGVVEKSPDYYNPFETLLPRRAPAGGDVKC